MAPPQRTDRRLQALKAVVKRLTSIQLTQLPHVVSFLANDLLSCKDILSLSESQQKAVYGPDSIVLVHKLKTRLSSLLQEKKIEARWAAVVLIKATVEAGGWEILQASSSWIRALISLLGRPDPPASKKITILTLTRIYLLTHGHQSLVRELTTPTLPSFITACLNAASLRLSSQEVRKPDCCSPLLGTVLQAFIRLLPNHPSTFRPFVRQLRAFLTPVLAPTPSSSRENVAAPTGFCSTALVTLAQSFHALLHHSAPKNTANEDWNSDLHQIITTIHRTADHIFRAVIEDLSTFGRPGDASVTVRECGKEVEDDKVDDLGLPSWRGIRAGSERLIGLLEILQAYVATSSPSVYVLGVSTLTPAIERLLAVSGPSLRSQPGIDVAMRLNLEIDKEERESLWLELPRIHATAMDTLTILLERLGFVSTSLAHGSLEQLIWLFNREAEQPVVRASAYRAICLLLRLIGRTLSKSTVLSMKYMIEYACADVLPMEPRSLGEGFDQDKSKSISSNGPIQNNVDSYLSPNDAPVVNSEASSEIQNLARDVLFLTLSTIPAESIPLPMRIGLDRAAILTRNKEAMVASVLNPTSVTGRGKVKSSIMPILAREYPGCAETEALIRPRMPLVQSCSAQNNDHGSQDDTDVQLQSRDTLAQAPRSLHNGFIFRQPEAASNPTGPEPPPQVSEMVPLQESSFGTVPLTSEPTLTLKTVEQSANKRAHQEDQATSPALSSDPQMIVPLTKRPRVDEPERGNLLASTSFGDLRNSQINVTTSAVLIQEPPSSPSARLPVDEDSDEGSEIPAIVPELVMSSDEDEEEDEDGM